MTEAMTDAMADGMTEREQALAELAIHGFTVVREVLDAEQVAAMKEALVRCEREVGTEHHNRGTARHVANLPTLDPVFFACLDHPSCRTGRSACCACTTGWVRRTPPTRTAEGRRRRFRPRSPAG